MVHRNNIISKMAEVERVAWGLNCIVVAVLGAIILCQSDDCSYITWRVSVSDEGIDFLSGCYDLTKNAGRNNLLERSLT